MRSLLRAFRLLGTASLVFGSLACAENGPARAPDLGLPERELVDYVPRDLDVLVRFESDPVRAAFLAVRGEDEQASGIESFVREAMRRSDVVYLGLRLSSDLLPLDGVLVASGIEAEELEELVRRLELHAGVMEGGGTIRYDAKRCDKRTMVCRVYHRADGTLIAATNAELDAVERTVEKMLPGTDLRVAGSGMVGAAVRLDEVKATFRRSNPKAAAFLDGARRLELSLDRSAGRYSITFGLEFENEERAERASRGIALYLELLSKQLGLGGSVAPSERILTRVVVRLNLPEDAFSEAERYRGAP